MQRLEKVASNFRPAAFRKLGRRTDPRLKPFWAEMAQEWQRLVDERKGSKSEHTHFRRHEVDPGD